MIYRQLFSGSIRKILIPLIFLSLVVVTFVFLNTGFPPVIDDTYVYVSQIDSFSPKSFLPIIKEDLGIPLDSPELGRVNFLMTKPFYGVVGSVLSFVLNPLYSILIINIFFLLGFCIALYSLYKLLNFSDELAFVGTFWTILSYPVLKYGIVLGTDISGWFFSVATVSCFLFAIKKKDLLYIFLSAAFGILGALSKETGVIGLLLCGLYLLFNYRNWGMKKVLLWIFALGFPVVLVYGSFCFLMYQFGAPSFLDWYKFNQGIYLHDFFHLKNLIWPEASSFGVILPLFIVGIYRFIFSKERMREEKITNYILPSLIAVLPVFLWPTFLSRVLFIQFLFVYPVVLFGLNHILSKYKLVGYKKYILYSIPPIVGISLFFLSGNGSLLKVVRGIVGRFL